MIQTYFSEKPFRYTGNELRPHYLYEHYQLRGNALVASIGPCSVSNSELVDIEDRLQNEFIAAESMVHFIGEWFGMGLREGVLLQRLIVANVQEELSEVIQRSTGSHPVRIQRDGNDLYRVSPGSVREKLSVSIATVSPVSALIHYGLNIDATGAPVNAKGLNDLGVDPVVFAKKILNRVSCEWESVVYACVKVKPV